MRDKKIMSKRWFVLLLTLALSVVLSGGCVGPSSGTRESTAKSGTRKPPLKKKRGDTEWVLRNLMNQEQFDQSGGKLSGKTAPGKVTAIKPAHEAVDVELLPEFRWQIDPSFGNVNAVTFALYSEEDLRAEEAIPSWIVIAIRNFDHFTLFKEPKFLETLGSLCEKERMEESLSENTGNSNLGLQKGKIYYWRIIAVGDDGRRAKGFFRFRTKR